MIKRPPVKLKSALRKIKLKGRSEMKVVPEVVKADIPSKKESIKFKVPDRRKGRPPINERKIHNTVTNRKPSLILKRATVFGVPARKSTPANKERIEGIIRDGRV